MLSFDPIGYVKTPYANTQSIPKGLGAKHEAEGILEILPKYEIGLTDIEGFSHLIVLWVFDRSGEYELIGKPPTDSRPHGVFATRSPRRPNPIGLTVVSCFDARAGSFMCAELICSMERRSSTSSLICRAFRRSSFAAVG